MATTMQPFTGTYDLDHDHSTVQFAVRHQQIATFRATFGDVDVRLTADNGTIALDGRTRVESVSISTPAEFREHVVRSADFFDADTHPAISFRSTRVDLRDDGSATVSGELTIRGATRTIDAHGVYQPPRKDPFGNERAGLELQATIDRRNWDMNWQMPLPDGADALGWDVEITAQLELIKTA
jgi:polyisoprenoid-binding protein YceI